MIVQKFRSPVGGNIISIRVNAVDNSILWKHILKTFGNVDGVRVKDLYIHFMTDENYENLLPLRIEAYPESTMDIILSKDPKEKDDAKVETPPKYNHELKHSEKIRAKVLQFKSHTNKLGDDYVRFGSRISLRHAPTGSYLQSAHWKYKTSSQQHAVQGARSGEPGLSAYWQVVPASGNEEAINKKTGSTIPYGIRVRLFNVNNKRWLHSHDYKSPVSNQREVTTFGSAEASNNDDIWIVDRFENGTEYWKTTDLFILRHESTNHYLHSHSTIYMGENEITCFEKFSNLDNCWRAGFA
ncbi:hypothetical protein BGZ76_002320 [Entomortierella beljakovae]|nr:hypothetical protein BGZ76_002320 [Entomortierella beljakovae]